MRTSLASICLNPKVIAGLIVVAVAVFIFIPEIAIGVLPLLLIAACPLSMLLMGGAMMRGHNQADSQAKANQLHSQQPSDEE